ncbi:MAG TPA: DUF2946 family protein [Frateuria sp.]|nr:DUF2946 family protein [Frateuria sp.]
MLAIALTVAMPVISRLLPVPVAPMGMTGMAALDHHGGRHDPPGAPTTTRCGYCDLLGHMPVLLGVASLPVLSPLPPARSGGALPAPRQTGRPVLAAAPRGPPGDLPV